MTPVVQLRVLGPLEVDARGEPCPISSPLQRRLLTALAMGGGTTIPISLLIDRLWGEDPPPAARNSLQSHIARLRARLGNDAIRSQPPGYALELSSVSIDAVEFEHAVDRARSEPDEGPDAIALALRTALDLWRGPAHAEFAEDLARSDALRLENLRIEARELLAEAYLRAGDRSAAVETLLRLQGDVPLREDLAVAAAKALHAVDRTAEALGLLRTYRSRLNEELGLDPGHAVMDLEQRLLRRERMQIPIAIPSPMTRRSAPPWDQGTELVTSDPRPAPDAGTGTLGRDDERAAIVEALSKTRLLTLVGPGGVGKTRLATVVAQERARHRGGGIAWVDLTTVTSPADVAPLIIECLGLTSPDRAAPKTAATAVARFDGLVVLDNCEHVLDTAAEVVELALAAESGTRLLATSRERLDVAGEQVVLVSPLEVPEPGAASEHDPAVQLFLQHLVATGGTAVTAARAAEVAAAVGGLPLAIELAAARAATMPVDELLDRLDHHLELLAGSPRRHGERHRTVANVIAWSYELLSDRERAVFRRVSVFASSFRLTEAERICTDDGLSPADVVESVARLVETSMVTRVGTGRYRLLEPLRLYGARQLQEDRAARSTWDRHRDDVLALAARADAEITGPGETAIIVELEQALPDLRAVHARAIDEGDLATVALLAGRLHRFAYAQARGDLLGWGGRLIDPSGPDVAESDRLRAIAASIPAEAWHNRIDEATRRAALIAAHLEDDDLDLSTGITLAETIGDLYMLRGELEAAAAVYERGVDLARHHGHPGFIAYMLAGLSIITTFLGDRRTALRLAQEAVDLARHVAAPTAIALAAYAQGEALSEDEPDAALAAFEAAVTAASDARVPFFEAIARTADVALRGQHGDPGEAFRRYRGALEIWSATSADGMAVTALRNLVVLLARTGADAAALTLHAALERLAPRRSYGHETDRLRTALRSARERLPVDDQELAELRGASIADIPDAIRFGLTTIDQAATS